MQIITSLRDVIIIGVNGSTNISSLRDDIIMEDNRSNVILSLRDNYSKSSLLLRFITPFTKFQEFYIHDSTADFIS